PVSVPATSSEDGPGRLLRLAERRRRRDRYTNQAFKRLRQAERSSKAQHRPRRLCFDGGERRGKQFRLLCLRPVVIAGFAPRLSGPDEVDGGRPILGRVNQPKVIGPPDDGAHADAPTPLELV